MSDKRRAILFVHGADEWYGSDVVLYDIVRALEGTEFDPVVLVPDDIESELPAETRLSGRLAQIGIPTYTLPLTVMRRRYMNLRGGFDLMRRMRPAVDRALEMIGPVTIDIVHSHTSTVLTGAQIAAKLGVPHVWHVSEIVQRPRIIASSLARYISRSADRVVAVSEAVREHLAATVPTIRSKCDVIYNALDPVPFNVVSTVDARMRLRLSGEFVVGMVGRVGTMKGQEVLLAAAPDILREHPDTTFLLVGGVLQNRTTDLDRLIALANDLGIASRVRILGFETDVATVIAAMDVLVQPSVRPESFGMTVLEAMAGGKPVIAAAHGGALETVREGETGMLVPPGDAKALAKAVNMLLADGALRERFGSAGRTRVEAEFAPSDFRQRYLEVYRQLLRQ